MVVERRSGLNYLSLAFSNKDIVFEEKFENPAMHSGYVSKRNQKFDEEFDFQHQELPVITDLEIRTKERVASQGIDILAWYCPYSSHGKYWGIYFDVEAIDSYAKFLHRQLIQYGAIIHFGTTIKFLYEAISRHELEHFNIELASAMMIVEEKASRDSYKTFSNSANFKYLSEVNATFMEFFDRSSQKGMKLTAQSVFYFLYMNQSLPSPYSSWRDLDLSSVSLMLEEIFGTPGFRDKLNTARELTGFNGRSKFVRVPKYYWYANPKNASVEDLSCRVRVDCKSTISWVKKSEKFFPDQFVQVEPAKDHQIQVKSKSQPFPVKLSCHDWNQIPPHVITQLANVYQIDKIQLVERIRRGK